MGSMVAWCSYGFKQPTAGYKRHRAEVWGHTNRESLASHKAFLGRPKAWRALKKVSLLSVLAVAEHIIYFFVALALIVPIVMLFVSAAMSMLQVSEAGILQTV